MENNFGADSYNQGVSDANSIYKVHGIKTIKELAKYTTAFKNDYLKGKINRARKIVEEHSNKSN